ncbi:MAG: sodium-dependent bicarbonate transport family permease [Bacteroidia bacterium]|nr:sodium-dependent bicarbonate transport family permease [Bacteroidia bacterium]
MNFQLLSDNLTNPALLFFVLGIIAVYLRSDLEIPSNSSKFISIYLLFSIGFKGGQELSHETIDREILYCFILGLSSSILIPYYTFYLLKTKLKLHDAGAIAASYGSVSAVTFVTASAYLEGLGQHLEGHMVAVMALMESPAIIVGLLMVSLYSKQENEVNNNKSKTLSHAMTNGSVLLIIGSLLIGFITTTKHAEGIKPFTNDIFKGFLAIFLLDMGIMSGRKLNSMFSYGSFPLLFALIIPLLNGCLMAYLANYFVESIANRFILAVLAASASYIAVPAAMKIANPKADPGLYLPMPLALTFPMNITLGFPIYYSIATYF